MSQIHQIPSYNYTIGSIMPCHIKHECWLLDSTIPNNGISYVHVNILHEASIGGNESPPKSKKPMYEDANFDKMCSTYPS